MTRTFDRLEGYILVAKILGAVSQSICEDIVREVFRGCYSGYEEGQQRVTRASGWRGPSPDGMPTTPGRTSTNTDKPAPLLSGQLDPGIRACWRWRPAPGSWRSSWRSWADFALWAWTSARRLSRSCKRTRGPRACSRLSARQCLGNAVGDQSFDLIVCRAAFKNFADPGGRAGERCIACSSRGKALIFDLRPDAMACSHPGRGQPG